MKLKTILLAVFGVILSMNAAMASQWYALDAGNSTCIPAPFTPAQMVAGLRQEGTIPKIKVFNDQGAGREVLVTSRLENGQSSTVDFFTRMSACQAELTSLVNSGALPNFNELK